MLDSKKDSPRTGADIVLSVSGVMPTPEVGCCIGRFVKAAFFASGGVVRFSKERDTRVACFVLPRSFRFPALLPASELSFLYRFPRSTMPPKGADGNVVFGLLRKGLFCSKKPGRRNAFPSEGTFFSFRFPSLLSSSPNCFCRQRGQNEILLLLTKIKIQTKNFLQESRLVSVVGMLL